MGFKQWILPQLDKEQAKLLAEECQIEPFTALIAAQRGYNDPFELEVFLSGDVIETEPLALVDMRKAAEIIGSFVAEGKKITVFGDYDCDGVTSTVLLYRYLKSVDAQVDYYIPSRLKEGYGMSVEAIDRLHAQKTELIITVDNGISAHEPIERANALGMTVVVTDHHRPQGTLPPAAAVVDPHRADSGLEFCDFAGVGVAFLLICALSGNDPAFLLEEYGELVTIGTVADVMPLRRDNRAFVKKGLGLMNRHPTPGVAALAAVAGVEDGKITAGALSFSLAPRINAAGRLAEATLAADLLLAETAEQANLLARQLDDLNQQRQQLEQDILKRAVLMVEQQRLYQNRVIVVSGENWHEGILGIAAARIAERYDRPTILMTENREIGIAKGSARTVGDFSIFEAISGCAAHLLGFGGHAQAAGLSLKMEQIGPFRQAINTVAMQMSYPLPQLHIDCKLNPAAVNLDLLDALQQLEPFGVGNPAPIFGLFGMKLERITAIGGGKHLRLLLSKGNHMVAALLFGVRVAEFSYPSGSMVDVVVALKRNVYNGEPQVSVMVKDLRPAGLNETQKIAELMLYDRFANAALQPLDAKQLLFDRGEMAVVYRAVRSGLDTLEKLRVNLSNFSWAKISFILDVLSELGLLQAAADEAQGRHYKLLESEKTNLEHSRLYGGLKSLLE